MHPRTNSKLERMHGELERMHGELERMHGELERMHGELERKLHLFKKSSAAHTTRSVSGRLSPVGNPFYMKPASNPVDRFFWFNSARFNMTLDALRREAPMQALYHLLPKEGDNVLEDLNSHGIYD